MAKVAEAIVKIKGVDEISRPLSRIADNFKGLDRKISTTGTNKMAASLGRIGEMTTALLSAQGLAALGGAFVQLSQDAFSAVSEFESMSRMFEQLLAREYLNTGQFDDMAEALKAAAPEAKKLLDWSEKLAIASPFSQSDVTNSFKLLSAYGFMTDDAQKLTGLMLDFGAATGSSGDTLNRIALAMGQIKSKGKLSAEEVMQLTEAGLGVGPVLKKLGADLNNLSKTDSDAFLRELTKMLENDFGGAAARAGDSLMGIANSFDDLKQISLREVFGPMFEELKPLLVDLRDTLGSPEFRTGLQEMGKNLGAFVKDAVPVFSEFITSMGTTLPESLDKAVTALDKISTNMGLVSENTDETTKGTAALEGVLKALEGAVWGVGAAFDATSIAIGLYEQTGQLVRAGFADLPGLIGQSVESFGYEVLRTLFGVFMDQQQADTMAGHVAKFIRGAFTTMLSAWMPSINVWAVGEIIAQMASEFERLKSWAYEWGQWIIDAIKQGFSSKIEEVGQAVNRLIDKFKKLGDIGSSLPEWLIPGSPTPFELGLKGIANAMRNMPDLSRPFAGVNNLPMGNPAMAMAPATAVNTYNINVDGIALTSGAGSIDEALQMFADIIRRQVAQ